MRPCAVGEPRPPGPAGRVHLPGASSNYPSLDLQLQQSYEHDTGGIDGDTDERSVLLMLRYNLFRGGADRAEQRKRASVMHEEKAFLDRVRRQVMDTLNLSWAANRAVREQLPYLRTHVEKARQTLESYLEEFVLNQRDRIDLLDTEAEFNTARIRLTEARYEALTARRHPVTDREMLDDGRNSPRSLGK